MQTTDNQLNTGTKNNVLMKNILKISVVALVLALGFMAFKPYFVTNSEKDKLILTLVGNAIERLHYEPIKIDDSFSSKAFDEYLERLDYGKKFLLKSDVEELEKFRNKIDDEIQMASFELYNFATGLIKRRHAEAKTYWEKALESDFDFTEQETVQINRDSIDYCKTEVELKDYWRKLAKLAVLERYVDLCDNQDTAIKKNDTAYKVKTLDELKADAVKSVKEYKRIPTYNDREWLSIFINSIVAACDPHSEFMMPDDKEDFDISMSGKFEGIGATLQSKNGQTKVADIIPGSASWRQGELEVNDIILKVAQGDSVPVDIANMELPDVVKKIRGKKGSTVKLTVKKIDGSVKVIPIIRDVVIIEETYAKSAVVKSVDGNTKIGYIFLPKFYADFNDRSGRFCSKDVKQELEKLKKENVDGIVLDLRNNGGGSLSEVVDMSGLFIKEGPIVQVKTREGSIRQLEDKNSDVVYAGPVVLMVNSFSASASEILSAALQDCDRAVIMGSQSTFGKGTVQQILDFDNYIAGHNSIKPLGAMKLTIQKFYRINGGTTQLKGVIPDIVLPDSYAYMKVGEAEYHNALAFDNIPKAKYELWKHDYKTKKVVANSIDRIKKNEVFAEIDQNALRLKKRSDESTFQLNIDKYRAEQKIIKEESEKFAKIGKEPTGVKADFNKADYEVSSSDSLKVQKFKRWFGDIEKDIYISEAINVISDMK